MGQAANCFKQLLYMFKVIIKLWKSSKIWCSAAQLIYLVF